MGDLVRLAALGVLDDRLDRLLHERDHELAGHLPLGAQTIGQAAVEIGDAQLQTFLSRWKPFLTETQLGICTHIYRNSVSVGRESCFTSTAKLMAAVSKTERQVKTVINQLIDWGFLVKGETVVNAPREDRGTYYRLNIDKA